VRQVNDVHGLDELASAVRYRKYLAELITPYCGDSLLEVGAGFGEFAALIPRRPGRHLIVSDTRHDCLRLLRERFANRNDVDVMQMDARGPIPPGRRIDTVVAINVLEHIEDDLRALKNLRNVLDNSGRVILFVPAYPALFGPFDKAVGHFRRYTPASLRLCVQEAGFVIDELRPVNMIGGIAWWFAVRLGRSTRPRPLIIRIYDAILVPIVRITERWFTPPFGQSLICIATRGNDTANPGN
jgi:SAM-dependent methyltransferase